MILTCIVASSICLAIDGPSVQDEAGLQSALAILDYIFLGIFTIEALVKIITRGLAFNGRHSYLRDTWNVLDFIVVLSGFAMIITRVAVGDAASKQLMGLRALRTLRVLRPLRMASRFPSLKLVISALFSSILPLANVLLVGSLFILIFAILGVNLFAGKFYSCKDNSGDRYGIAWRQTP